MSLGGFVCLVYQMYVKRIISSQDLNPVAVFKGAYIDNNYGLLSYWLRPFLLVFKPSK